LKLVKLGFVSEPKKVVDANKIYGRPRKVFVYAFVRAVKLGWFDEKKGVKNG